MRLPWSLLVNHPTSWQFVRVVAQLFNLRFTDGLLNIPVGVRVGIGGLDEWVTVRTHMGFEWSVNRFMGVLEKLSSRIPQVSVRITEVVVKLSGHWVPEKVVVIGISVTSMVGKLAGGRITEWYVGVIVGITGAIMEPVVGWDMRSFELRRVKLFIGRNMRVSLDRLFNTDVGRVSTSNGHST